jgi:hypothetical protein
MTTFVECCLVDVHNEWDPLEEIISAAFGLAVLPVRW